MSRPRLDIAADIPLDLADADEALTPCVRCERRIWPECEVITVHKFKPAQVDGAWACDGHVPYAQEAA